MTAFGIASILLVACQQTQIKPKHNVIDVDKTSAPVTCEEAVKVFGDARRIIGKSLSFNLGAPALRPSKKPVAREQVIGEMAAITHALDPEIKFTPRAPQFTDKVFRIAPSELGNLKMLVRLGYVGKVSPLATGPGETLTIRQFGDALGLFLSRTAELTHMPQPKWSPILGAGS